MKIILMKEITNIRSNEYLDLNIYKQNLRLRQFLSEHNKANYNLILLSFT